MRVCFLGLAVGDVDELAIQSSKQTFFLPLALSSTSSSVGFLRCTDPSILAECPCFAQ